MPCLLGLPYLVGEHSEKLLRLKRVRKPNNMVQLSNVLVSRVVYRRCSRSFYSIWAYIRPHLILAILRNLIINNSRSEQTSQNQSFIWFQDAYLSLTDRSCSQVGLPWKEFSRAALTARRQLVHLFPMDIAHILISRLTWSTVEWAKLPMVWKGSREMLKTKSYKVWPIKCFAKMPPKQWHTTRAFVYSCRTIISISTV